MCRWCNLKKKNLQNEHLRLAAKLIFDTAENDPRHVCNRLGIAGIDFWDRLSPMFQIESKKGTGIFWDAFYGRIADVSYVTVIVLRTARLLICEDNS